MRRLISIGTTVIAISAIGYSAFIIHQVIQTDGYSPEVASGIATLGLVTVTIWYAWSTGRLTGLYKEEIRATKATYAPNLNPSCDLNEDSLEVNIENTGSGPAKSLTIDFDIIHEQTAYRYRADVVDDVGPNSSIATPGDENIVLTPRFKKPKVNVSKSFWDKIASFAFGEFRSPVTGASEVKGYDKLISEFRSNSDNPEEVYLSVSLTVRYTDILQEKQYTESRLQNHRASISRDGLGNSISDAYEVMHFVYNSPETRREYLRNVFLGKGEVPKDTIEYVEEVETESTPIK